MTIQSVTSGPSGTPTVLTRDGCYTLVFVTVGSYPNTFVQLPSGCLSGDGFEIYTDPIPNGQNAYILPPSGEDFGDPSLAQVGGVGALAGNAGGNPSFIIRKLTSTRWGFIRG